MKLFSLIHPERTSMDSDNNASNSTLDKGIPNVVKGKWYLIHNTTSKLVGVFVIIHLVNHLFAIAGPETHLEFMEGFRFIYRNTVAEIILISSCLLQVVTGLKLGYINRNIGDIYDKLQRWSGVYIALFLLAHISAVLILARIIMDVDSNFYFGAAGLLSMPAKLFFIPYYSLAVLSFGIHIACSLRKIIGKRWGIPAANKVFATIFILTMVITFIIIMTFSGIFYEIELPEAYRIPKI